MSNPKNQNSPADIEDFIGNDEGSIDLSDQLAESVETGSPNDIEVVETMIEDPAEGGSTNPGSGSIESELEKYKDIAARSQADLDNYRKRMARERTEAIQYANVSLLSTLIPVIDSFEMGLKAAKNEGENSVIYTGMVMIQKQLNDFLSENRVEQIEVAEGADFDPNLHEAIKEEASETVTEGKVIYSMRSGYRLKDRLLRPANVVVSKGSAAEQSSEEEE